MRNLPGRCMISTEVHLATTDRDGRDTAPVPASLWSVTSPGKLWQPAARMLRTRHSFKTRRQKGSVTFPYTYQTDHKVFLWRLSCSWWQRWRPPPEVEVALPRFLLFLLPCRPEVDTLSALPWPAPLQVTYSASGSSAATTNEKSENNNARFSWQNLSFS